MLDLTDRLIVIVGGGGVGARKAAGLLAAGATKIRVVSPTFDPGMPTDVERISALFAPSHLHGASLVFAATNSSQVNSAVVAAARGLKILVNRADAEESEPGDFSTPALYRDGPLTITVATAGNPALAAAVRDDLQSKLDPRWAALARMMTTLRPGILAANLTPADRKALFHDLSTPLAASRLATEGPAEFRTWIEQRIGKKLDIR